MEKEETFKLEVVSVRLVKDAPIYSERPFSAPEDVASVLGEMLSEMDREVLCVVNLKTDLTPINVNFVSMGSLNACISHPREILKTAILSNAANMMLIHSHPSGNKMPSSLDIEVTDRMINLCSMIEIPLLDHLIVGGDNREFFSFREKGLIENPRYRSGKDYRELEFREINKGKAR